MGCSNSKVDDLPAVSLCRERCAFLDEAIHLRYALAEAHIAYVKSLRGIGHSLHNFIEQGIVNSSGSPHLNLPPQRKGGLVGSRDIEASASPLHDISHSNSGSHFHFHSDSDDESGSLHDSDQLSPLHHEYMAVDQEGLNSYPGGGIMHMNYMKNKATPSVVYEQRPMIPEKVYHMGESSSSSGPAYYPYPYPNMNSNPYPYYGYPNYAGGIGGYYGSPSPPPAYGSMSPMPAPASSSKPPPPPPSPPRPSAWDFLNLFDTSDNYYSVYTPSRNSQEVRIEEGIPELEEEDYQREVVKEVDGNRKVVDSGGGNHSKVRVDDNIDEVDDKINTSLYQIRPTAAIENEELEYQVHVVEKKVVPEEERSEEHGNGAAAFKRGAGTRDVTEVAGEIKVQFERASEAGEEIAKMLEVGKLPYQHKHVSSKMLHVVKPSLPAVSSKPSTSKTAESSSSTVKAGSSEIEFGDAMGMRSGNVSSTLQKLYLWEKKLYNEVKSEENMRVMHDKKRRKLKRMDERGAEAKKVESTQTLIRSLSTKITMAIQVVDKISVTVNKIRDEELWPQLNELIQGLLRMWKCMLECHRSQYQAISEARSLSAIRFGKKLDDAHLGGTLNLEHELINWTLRFSSWIRGQKGFIRALNNWLLKCLIYEPEETPDGIAPFSPSRIGAPPVFVICNQWSQALDRISEKEVIDSMHVFTTSVLQIWDHDKLEMREQMMGNKDLEGKVRKLDRDDQKIQKEIKGLDKKMVPVSGGDVNSLVTGHDVYRNDTGNGSLKADLQRIFEAMERFTADSMKMYEDLLSRSEEERLEQRHERAS